MLCLIREAKFRLFHSYTYDEFGFSYNRVSVNKIFIEQNSIEPKVKVLILMYKPLQVSKCEKCGKVIAEPKKLIRI